MNEAQPKCPDCGGSLFDSDTKFYCWNCEKQFCPYCMDVIEGDLDKKPYAHYVIMESGTLPSGSYLDLLDRMPEYLMDDAGSVTIAEALATLEASNTPFLTAYVDFGHTYYQTWYSEIGGDSIWKQILPLLK